MAGRAQIGQLDDRITFQSETTADDLQGGTTSSGWANIPTIPTMWAKIMGDQGTEGDEGEKRQANVYRVNVTIRNRSDLTEKMRIVWRGRSYNIRSIPPYRKRDEFLTIQAEGGVPL